MIIDLHVHSRHTAGCPIEPAEAIRKAAEVGLDGVCFTDQDTLAGLSEYRALAQEAPIKVFVGAEIATDRGHYLCFFPDPAKVPELGQLLGEKPWPVRDVIARVGSLGGAVAAAHPFDREIERPGGDVIYTLQGLAAVEVHNPRRRPMANELAAEAAENLRLPCISGSDSRPSLEHMGKAATLFKRAVASEAELVEAIKKGEVWAVTLGGSPSQERERRGPPRGEKRQGRGRGGERRGGRGRGGRGRGRGPRDEHESRAHSIAARHGEDVEEPPLRPSSDGARHVELTAPQGEPPPRGRK